MRTVALLALVASASAFAPAARGAVSRSAMSRVSRRGAVSMELVGATKPLGKFDPLGLGKDEAKLTQYREAELKHGRLAMLAMLGIFVQSAYHPLYQGASMSNNPFEAAAAVPALGWVQIAGFASFVEFLGILAKKRADYQPGDLLGSSEWVDNSDEGWVDYQQKELNNGRLAMMAFLGIWVQHVVLGLGSADLLFKPLV